MSLAAGSGVEVIEIGWAEVGQLEPGREKLQVRLDAWPVSWDVNPLWALQKACRGYLHITDSTAFPFPKTLKKNDLSVRHEACVSSPPLVEFIGLSMKKRFAAVLFAVAAAASSQVMALPVTFIGSGTGPGPVPVSASAVFDISGSTFTITLRNTSPSNSGQDVPGSTLTGLFFFGLDKRAAHSNQADCQVVSQRMV